MIVRAKNGMDGGQVTAEMLRGVLAEHAGQKERLRRLKEYYLGKTEILKRVRAAGLPNNRIAHAFARYIVTVTVGYLVGEGVGYQAAGADRSALDGVLRAYRSADIGSVDTENARNAAIYGKGVELICVPPGSSLPRAFALSPEDAFVVYTDDILHEPLFGVYAAGSDGAVITVTDRQICRWENGGGAWVRVSCAPHYFSAVPMVEYWNDENERGDFEWVIPLIDAYDSLQSDRLNDKDQFADKLLVLTGCTLETDEQGRPPWLQLRMDKALCLPDENASAGYLSGEMNESGNEILRRSLCEDIHKLSLVPDLSDEHFAGNASGVAMKYKLLGLEQLTGMKQQWFTEGLRQRLKLFGKYLALRGAREPDPAGVNVTFTRSLPENLTETAEVIKNARAAGAMSTRTMVEMLHKNGDWDEERLRREAEEARREQEETK